ncbi:MAG: hypothetical protein KDA84_16785, partial [Planctomycetaceae bacterium]|nr:hypothetical protein [Planctomycetaceae bacterium]
LENGDVILGELTAVGSRQIQLRSSAFDELKLPWRNVRRIVFGETDFPAHPIAPELPRVGWQANIQFHRLVDHPTQPGDELTAAITGVQEGELTIENDLLGKIHIPIGDINWIEPLFLGSRWTLANEKAHLGNQVQPKFRHHAPLGSSWHGEFYLNHIPEGSAFIRVQVAELEPAGKGTPLGSRYLSELRNGFLGTSLVLNGESLGRLNDHISQKKTLEGHQTVRLRVPSRLLKKGKNTWRVEQTSRRDNPQEYDDCQIGPILLEIESQ